MVLDQLDCGVYGSPRIKACSCRFWCMFCCRLVCRFGARASQGEDMFSRHAWGFEGLSIWRAMPFDYEKSIDLWEDSPQTRAGIWAIAAGLQELSGRGSEVSP